MRTHQLAIALLILLCPISLKAFYCDSYIIDRDDTAAEVLGRCGEPATTTSWTVEESRGVSVYGGTPVRTRTGTIIYVGGSTRDKSVTHVYEEWVYNFGPSRFLYIVTFKNGRIVKIEDSGYGY